MHSPNLPEETMQVSWRSLKGGGAWLILAMLADFFGGSQLHRHPEWPALLRAAIGFLSLGFGLLYVRSVMRWIRGMDELHRQLMLNAFLFATIAYLVFSTIWLTLDRSGAFAALAQTTQLHLERVDFRSCALILGLTHVFWGIGYTHIFSRRFR
jgi:hypothetical protein